MVDHYYGNESTASCEAVATLLYQIGSACDMAYDMSGSGAKDVYVQYALINNFNYNPGVKYILHDFMSDTEWDNAIYEELAAGRPVIMAGHGTKGGHCFVVDGYDGEGYYHINWGWGGYQDGFFMLNNLSPAAGGIGSFEGGYNLSQGALIEVFPAGHNDTAPQERIVSDTNMVINDSDRKICCSGDNAIFYNPTGRTISGSIVLCVERIDAVDNNVYSEVVRNFTNLAPLRGFWDFSLPTVSDVPDGNYKATLWLETKSGNRSQIISPYGMSDYVLVNIKNGKISSYKSENGSIQVGISSITGLDYAHAGEPLMITAKLTNFSNSDFSGKVSLKIYSKAEELVLTDSRKYTVKPESAEEVNFFTSRLPKTGEYLIRFETADGTISETIPFTVEAASDLSYGEKGLEVTYVSNTVYLDGVKTIAPNVIISNNLSQAQGFSPTAYLYDKDMKELTSASVGLYIPAKSESEANLSINYPNLSAGTYYISLRSSTYGNVSPYIPIRIFKYGQTDEVAYEVVSETDRKARIIAPASGYYSGSVVIPETVGDNYSVTEIDPTAIMGSSGVTEVTLPSSIRFIPGGTFVGTSIEELTIASQVPPVLGRGAFDMRGSMNTRLCIPDGTANTYARTSSWETFHIPSWTFTVEEGLNIGGLQNNPDVGKPFEPYYVSARETIEIEVSGADKIFADIAIANQELMLIEAENGKIKLPALGTADAKCRIVTDPSGINPVLSTGTEADIYNLQGIRVVKNADKASLPNLPAGVYIINGKKVQVK